MRTKGMSATYTTTSTIDLRRLLGGTRGAKIWSNDRPLAMRIVAAPQAWRAAWSDSQGTERYRLVRPPGGPATLIDCTRRTSHRVDTMPAIRPGERNALSWHNVHHDRFGALRRVVLDVARDERASAILTIDAQPRGISTSAPLAPLWYALAPWLGKDVDALGLPVAMRLEWLAERGGVASLRLETLETIDVPPGTFDIPADLKEVGSRSRRWRLPTEPSPRPPRPGPAPLPAAPPLFTGLGPETVKVVVGQPLIDAVFADARTATSYISGFSGTRFKFPTSDWFTQIVQAAPVPVDGTAPSVIPSLLVRVFIVQLCQQLHGLGLPALPPDAATLDAMVPDNDDTKRLKAFLAAVSRRANLRSAFGEVLARLTEALADGANAELACATLVLDSLESIVRSGIDTTLPFSAHPWVLLAEAWYGTFLPSIDVKPKYKTRQEIEDAVAVFHANGEVTIDELAELVDINLNDFEHSITFGNRPLFTPPTYVDTAGLRAIGTLQPWFRQLQNIRFGFLTSLSLAGAEVSCDIDITPALTPATAVLGFFCPPCVLSLFMTGSASASIENATFPVFLYLEQDPLRLDPPRWRTVFAEPQIADVDANIFVIGFNVVLALIIDVVGNAAGGFILNEILKSFGSELGDAVDKILAKLPELDASTIARLGRNPDVVFPPSEESRVAYEAPPRSAGGYQFEIFRQAVRGMGATLEFPAAGGTLDTVLALVLGSQRAGKLSSDITWPSQFGPFTTRKPDGSVSEIDWWTEARDLTGMPPRPANLVSGPPPGLLLIPQNVGQSWTTFNTILDVHLSWLGWRDLADSPADQPVADVLVSAWCRGEAIETEIIMYEDCQDVTHLAAGILDRWRGPRGPIGPAQPEGPDGPGVLISGGFLQRVGRPGAGGGNGTGPGWADGSMIGYWFDPGRGGFDPRTGGMPNPDDPGPPQVPGTFLCRDVVTLNARQRETWVQASLQFTLPVFVGLTEALTLAQLDQFMFLPAIRSALGETYPAPSSVNLDLVATGPLETLNLPENRAWIREMLVSIATGLAGMTGVSQLGPFHYDYGIDSTRQGDALAPLVADLRPERFLPPQANLRLATVTTWPAGAPLKRVAFKWAFEQTLLGRA